MNASPLANVTYKGMELHWASKRCKRFAFLNTNPEKRLLSTFRCCYSHWM